MSPPLPRLLRLRAEPFGRQRSVAPVSRLQRRGFGFGCLRAGSTVQTLHLSIVGGEPLARYRELSVLLPKLADMGVEVQLVTSAIRAIPPEWRKRNTLHIVVSVDGLQPEHDKRRFPATYERLLEHIAGHVVTIHCTITRQLLERPDYHVPNIAHVINYDLPEVAEILSTGLDAPDVQANTAWLRLSSSKSSGQT